ncbi:MAG: hypothetical protein JNL88_03820 [Bacteroidia bacterium]|nr:hypothetical protein [Bacteroidia bacterium]
MFKKYLFLFILLMSTEISSAQENDRQTLLIKTQVYCDHCQVCESCGGRMAKEMPYIKGLISYAYIDSSMHFSVTFNPKKTSPEKIRQAIARIGYDADEVKADSRAWAKFDECCLKQ